MTASRIRDILLGSGVVVALLFAGSSARGGTGADICGNPPPDTYYACGPDLPGTTNWNCWYCCQQWFPGQVSDGQCYTMGGQGPTCQCVFTPEGGK